MDGVPTTKLTLVVLVIIYNLAAAYFKKRAKKKAEEAARGGGVVDRGVKVSTSTEEVTMKRREAPARAARTGDEDLVQSWDEKSFDAEVEEARNPYRETSQPQPTRGKELLSQLAREIGFDLPEAPSGWKPAPAGTAPNGPLSKSPQAKGLMPKGPQAKGPAAPQAPSRNKRVTSYDDDHARTVADSAPGKDMTSAPGIAAVESANAAAYVTLDPLRPTALSALRADLFDGDALRRAFILKTVLDKPLSLQPRSLGAPGSAPHSVPSG